MAKWVALAVVWLAGCAGSGSLPMVSLDADAASVQMVWHGEGVGAVRVSASLDTEAFFTADFGEDGWMLAVPVAELGRDSARCTSERDNLFAAPEREGVTSLQYLPGGDYVVLLGSGTTVEFHLDGAGSPLVAPLAKVEGVAVVRSDAEALFLGRPVTVSEDIPGGGYAFSTARFEGDVYNVGVSARLALGAGTCDTRYASAHWPEAGPVAGAAAYIPPGGFTASSGAAGIAAPGGILHQDVTVVSLPPGQWW